MVSRLESTKNKVSELVTAAIEACEHAYAPYSAFRVGAAVLAGSGSMYGGCNIENISYGLSLCAERVAIAGAVAAGERDIIGVGVVADGPEPVRPCGACLQVMAEFSPREDPIAIVCASVDGSVDIRPLSDYLPIRFDLQPEEIK